MYTPENFIYEKKEVFCNENHINLDDFVFAKGFNDEFYDRLSPNHALNGRYPTAALEKAWALSSFEL